MQDEKLLKMRTPSKVDFNQPFKLMWMMIICNILCQLIELGESLAFKLEWNKNDKNTCPISQVFLINIIEPYNRINCELTFRNFYNVSWIHSNYLCFSSKEKGKG